MYIFLIIFGVSAVFSVRLAKSFFVETPFFLPRWRTILLCLLVLLYGSFPFMLTVELAKPRIGGVIILFWLIGVCQYFYQKGVFAGKKGDN